MLLGACGLSAEERYEQANAFFAKNQFEQAIPLYEQLRIQDANNINVLAKLALSYSYTQQWQKCAEVGEEAFKHKLDFMDLYVRVGECQEVMKQSKKALATYRAGLKAYPDQIDLKRMLARLLLYEGQYAEAVEVYKLLAQTFPEREDYLINIAYAYEKMKRYGEAEKYFRQVLSIDAQDANALFGIGHLYEIQNKPQQAIEYYQKALSANPQHLSAAFNLAQLYEQLQRKTDALVTWKKYIQIAQDKPSQKEFLQKAQTQLKKLQGGAPEPAG